MHGINVVQEMPVQSIVCSPPQNSTLTVGDDFIEVKGVAWSGGGSGIYRVDVSIDGGKTWQAASELYKPVVQHRRGQYGWTQFFHKQPLSEEMKAALARGEPVKLDIVSKAIDSHFNVQPDDPRPHWNSRGVVANHWYRVKATIDPSLKHGLNPAADLSSKGQFANTPSAGKHLVPWNEHGWAVPPQAKGQGHHDWYKLSNKENTKNEPGVDHTIDWNFYRSLKCAPFWEQPR
jgi:hypothetical protein